MTEAGEEAGVHNRKKDEVPEWFEVVHDYLRRNSKAEEKTRRIEAESNQDENLDIREELYNLLLQRLAELQKYSNPRSGVIRFPQVFSKLCRSFSVRKDAVWDWLSMLSDLGVLRIYRFQGIRLINNGHKLSKETLSLIKKKYE